MSHTILPTTPTVKNPPGQSMVVARVRFASGGHTAWLEHVADEDYHRP
ncbi:hypothetical protein [Brevibacterium sp. UCMA 11754]|nr:hypothetical protein [Brevibacterium sp. UCMA 11754]MCF2572449.1 hypothetical protein [Brevibacterium sp. UCMA 11754]